MENKTQSKDFPKRPRGRPKVFDSSMEAILKKSFSDKTQRGLQNKFYLLRAFRLIKNDPALRWLYDREAQTIQSTILGELGRIDRDEDLLNMARQICGLRPKVRDAILLIRAWRKSRKAVTPPAGNLYPMGYIQPTSIGESSDRKGISMENENLATMVPTGTKQPTTERQVRPLTHPEPEQPREEENDPGGSKQEKQKVSSATGGDGPSKKEDAPMADFAIWDYDEAAPRL